MDYTGRFVYASFDTNGLLLKNLNDTAVKEITSVSSEFELEQLCFMNMLNIENDENYRKAVLSGD